MGQTERLVGRVSRTAAESVRHDIAETDLGLAPVLVILDRNLDLFPMVSHSWTYQALVNDVLGMKLNRVSVEVSRIVDGSERARG